MVRADCQALDREPPEDGIVVSDTEGAVKRWFDEAPGGVVFLRPDRVVAAVCPPWQLNETLRRLAERMALDLDAAPQASSAAVPVEAVRRPVVA